MHKIVKTKSFNTSPGNIQAPTKKRKFESLRKPLGDITPNKKKYVEEKSIYDFEVEYDIVSNLKLEYAVNFTAYEKDILERYVEVESDIKGVLKDFQYNGCKVLFYANCVLEKIEINTTGIKTLSNACLRLGVATGVTSSQTLRSAYEFAPQWLSLYGLLFGSGKEKLIEKFLINTVTVKDILELDEYLRDKLTKSEEKKRVQYLEGLMFIDIFSLSLWKSNIIKMELDVPGLLKNFEDQLQELDKYVTTETYYLLGKLHFVGVHWEVFSENDIKKYKTRGIELVKAAAQGGHETAMLLLAEYYYRSGHEYQSLYWIKRAFKSGHEAGYFYWGYHVLLNRDDSDKENKESGTYAYDYFCKSRRLGCPKAAIGLSYYYINRQNNGEGSRNENLQKALGYWLIDLGENWSLPSFLDTLADMETYFDLKEHWPAVFQDLAQALGYGFNESKESNKETNKTDEVSKQVLQMIKKSGIVKNGDFYETVLENVNEEDLAKRLFVLFKSYSKYRQLENITDEVLTQAVQGKQEYIAKLREIFVKEKN